MFVELISPEKVFYSGECTMVRLPGKKGSFSVLDNHAPLISSLESGVVKITLQRDDYLIFDVESGFVEVRDNRVTICGDKVVKV
jgi:F-type H+-transporting ATPase subunit epsilon